MSRNINKAGIDLIKQFEGLRLKPYLCSAGKPTIGYGATFYEDGKKVTMSDPAITEQRAEDLLKKHLEQFSAAVERNVKVSTTDNQFAALVSFTFNLGEGNLKSSTLLKKLNNKDYAGAANEFERWNKAGGKILAGLTRRRQAEKSLFLHNPPASSSPVKQSWLSDEPTEDEINKKLEAIENKFRK
jgi:lysozyme